MLQPAFESGFAGIIWNVIAHPDKPLLFVETRDAAIPQVRFSAIDLLDGRFLWRDYSFEEPWWINMTETSGRLLFLSMFHDQQSPDKKSLVAFDFEACEIRWWRNNFSLSSVMRHHVAGVDLMMGMKKISLDLLTGQTVKDAPDLPAVRNFSVSKPLQYYPGTDHFDTVKAFLESKFGIIPVSLIEYLEYNALLFISCYTDRHGLANFLFVLRSDGTLVLEEKLDDGAKGIGIDTFFIFSGYLIFVKNKSLLVSYKVV